MYWKSRFIPFLKNILLLLLLSLHTSKDKFANSHWLDRHLPSDMVFCFAYLTLLLRKKCENFKPKFFMKLILAHFYQECPFLSGYFPIKSSDMSEEAYALKIGMRPGQNQDAYYRRIENLTRAFAALIEVMIF